MLNAKRVPQKVPACIVCPSSVHYQVHALHAMHVDCEPAPACQLDQEPTRAATGLSNDRRWSRPPPPLLRLGVSDGSMRDSAPDASVIREQHGGHVQFHRPKPKRSTGAPRRFLRDSGWRLHAHAPEPSVARDRAIAGGVKSALRATGQLAAR